MPTKRRTRAEIGDAAMILIALAEDAQMSKVDGAVAISIAEALAWALGDNNSFGQMIAKLDKLYRANAR